MTEEGYIRYKRRFLYLAVVIVLNFSNAMCWISFAPVTFYTNSYYSNSSAATLFNVIFMALSVPAGVASSYLTDRFGLRGGCYFGGFMNCLGNIVRLIGSGSYMPADWRFPVAFAGQIIAAISQPFIMYLPTKLTAYWFPIDQRNLANTLASMSNPLGIAAMYSLSSVFVNERTPDNFFALCGMTAGLSVVAFLLALTVTSSEPPTPASSSKTNVISPPFLQGVKKCVCSRSFLVLCFTLGGGVGLFNALYNNLQPALCAKGYSDTFSGAMGSLLIVSGLIGAAVSGIIADKYGHTKWIMKIAFTIGGIACASLAVAINYFDTQYWVAASVFGFGFFGFAIYPIGLEMGVDITYPVAEATSTGLIIMSGQILGVFYVLFTALATQPATHEELAKQTCLVRTNEVATVVNWKYSFLIWAGIVTFSIMVFVIFFNPKLRRREVEKMAALKSITEQNLMLKEGGEEEDTVAAP